MTAATLCYVTIDHSAPEPVHLQLAGILRAQIASGELPPRSALPSLTHLAAEHRLAVSTVQKALATLKAEGLIVTYKGRGTYVA
jgi:DNA-binding GntR family transcriptional regulator